MQGKIPAVLCVLFGIITGIHAAQDNPDPNRFDKEIKAFRAWDRKNAIPDDYVLMPGSQGREPRVWRGPHF
jgi:hypothetical protein